MPRLSQAASIDSSRGREWLHNKWFYGSPPPAFFFLFTEIVGCLKPAPSAVSPWTRRHLPPRTPSFDHTQSSVNKKTHGEMFFHLLAHSSFLVPSSHETLVVKENRGFFFFWGGGYRSKNQSPFCFGPHALLAGWASPGRCGTTGWWAWWFLREYISFAPG